MIAKVVLQGVDISFRIRQRAAFSMKSAKEAKCKRINLGNGFRLGELDEIGYKCLEIVKKGQTHQDEMKAIVKKEYFN